MSIIFLRSEGPAQVFLIILVWLTAAFRRMSREERKTSVFVIWHVSHWQPESCKEAASRRFAVSLERLEQGHWQSSPTNHKDPRCHQIYNPEKMKKDNPGYNAMCCEQNLLGLAENFGSYAKNTTTFTFTTWWRGGTNTFAMQMDVGLFSLK